jgi:hypothetical protein
MKNLLLLLLATSVVLTPLSSANAMKWFTPKEEIKQSNATAAEQVQVSSRDKLSRVIEGEKTPVRPVTITPQPNISLRGDNNIYMPAPLPEKSTDEIYAEFLQKQAEREFNAKHPPASIGKYREQTDYDSQSGATAQSDKKIEESDKSTIPLWFGVLMGCAALLAVIFVIKYALKQSVAATAIAKAADEQLANWVRDARSRAATETESAKIAALTAEMADLEAARGKLSAAKQNLGVK